jgi:hypothetical protein
MMGTKVIIHGEIEYDHEVNERDLTGLTNSLSYEIEDIIEAYYYPDGVFIDISAEDF